MVDIYCSGGAYYNVMMDFDVAMHLLEDGLVKDDDFIRFSFSDGSRGAVMKKYINGICESFEEV